MKKKLLEARYKTMSIKIIKNYRFEHAASKKLDCFFNREIHSVGSIERLTGGRVNGVYKVNQDGHNKVVKISAGVYRIEELKREAKVMKYLINEGYGHIIPDIDTFMKFDEFSYLIQEYIDGESVREKLWKNESVKERSRTWEKLGQVLSEIHTLCQYEDMKGEWLSGQLEIARINMESNFLDCEEFKENTPEKMFDWLVSNKPKRSKVCLLHGDFRTKNIMVDNQENYKVIDWGFVDIGDPYYDLAIIDYYFKDGLDRNSFYRGYNDSLYDKDLIEYYDKLSKFINI